MKFESNSVYHVYNRGNNRQKIFFSEANYYFFLNKIRKEICPLADIIVYCLTPNHYHLMLVAKELPEKHINSLHRKLGTLQSSYTRAINIQENRTVSLFQQKTKAIEICSLHDCDDKTDYLSTCFHYIHQNPLNAGLVKKMEEWKFSSFKDYMDLRGGNLINKQLSKEILEIDWDNFHEESYNMIDENTFRAIF